VTLAPQQSFRLHFRETELPGINHAAAPYQVPELLPTVAINFDLNATLQTGDLNEPTNGQSWQLLCFSAETLLISH
jgi:hypothetical protein